MHPMHPSALSPTVARTAFLAPISVLWSSLDSIQWLRVRDIRGIRCARGDAAQALLCAWRIQVPHAISGSVWRLWRSSSANRTHPRRIQRMDSRARVCAVCIISHCAACPSRRTAAPPTAPGTRALAILAGHGCTPILAHEITGRASGTYVQFNSERRSPQTDINQLQGRTYYHTNPAVRNINQIYFISIDTA